MAKDTNQRRPWDRLIDETQEEWELFELFLRERSVEKVAELYFTEDRIGISQSYTAEIRRSRKWNERVAAYDRWLTGQRDAAVAHMVKLEMRRIARRRVKVLRDLFNVVERVKQSVLPSNAEKNAVIKIGDAVMYSKLVQVLLDEYREIEKSNPTSAGKDSAPERALAGAQERMKAMIEANITKKVESEPNKPEAPPVLQ